MNKAIKIILKIKKIKNHISSGFYIFICELIFKKFTKYGKIHLNGIPYFRFFGETIFEDNLIFNSSTKYNTVGIYKYCSIYVSDGASLIVKKNTGFSGVSIHCSCSITIGEDCNFGGNVCIWDTDFHSINPLKRMERPDINIVTKPIEVGNNVFVGANSIILKGVTIGENSVIGAGSIVSRDIPSNEIWAGNPIVFIKKINT